jgi:hypothetical protein
MDRHCCFPAGTNLYFLTPIMSLLNATQRPMGCRPEVECRCAKLLCHLVSTEACSSFIMLYATLPFTLPVTADVHKHNSFAAQNPRFRSHDCIQFSC